MYGFLLIICGFCVGKGCYFFKMKEFYVSEKKRNKRCMSVFGLNVLSPCELLSEC